jgi:hypothetical protein
MAVQTASVSPINAPSRGRRVQVTINELKGTIDDALAGGGRLMADIVDAGQEAHVLPQISQRAVERIHECMAAGIRMRALAIATHHDLRKIMNRLDLDAVGFGDLGPTAQDEEPALLYPVHPAVTA